VARHTKREYCSTTSLRFRLRPTRASTVSLAFRFCWLMPTRTFRRLSRGGGWKGARLKVGFLFYDLPNDVPLTDIAILFQGICNPPDEIREATFRITGDQSNESPKAVVAPGSHSTPVPVGVSGYRQSTHGGGGRRSKRQVLALLPVRVFGRRIRRIGKSERHLTIHRLQLYTRRICQTRGMSPNFGGIEFVPPGDFGAHLRRQEFFTRRR